ncbi:MAG TPA: ATP-binding cassette domain-containing protein [Thermoclostridium caenicola]|uniref:ATP-binding cassette domain-containing protein n=1 Tax=Thermoclostridium caenicola TaxID=659425 RepID=UPI002B7815A0|nr:ATP-binding cassette domain-containing protein [Thermoclostridium caenicola]HPO78057.1 ATP-binding cassette domain-containing protein [Thermoclostridium caenicola]
MITVKGLTKEFSGFQALKGLNMHVKAGEIYGFIGPNGSGKTTTMNILAGLSRPAQGECVVNGMDVTKLTHPGDLNIGYLPEDGMHFISSLLRLAEWTPSGLLAHANELTPMVGLSLLNSLCMTMLLIAVATAITLTRLKLMEWNVRNI